MPEFLELLAPDKARQLWLEQVHVSSTVEIIPTENSLGRVTAAPVTAGGPLPSFTRSTVDGFAVAAADTYGASDSLPAYSVWREILMASRPISSFRPRR
jgi:molybdopterin molybdotransferase